MKGLGRGGDDLGREGRRLSFHSARVSRSWWPVRWRQVLVGYGGATKEPRARKKKQGREATQGGLVLAGDTADGDWRRRRGLSSVVGSAVAALTVWCAVMGRRDA
ncbi:hypothetical protein DEO72_LG6g380 [Vigna unguiculata]|uniref:Uncharacterized protein n=1 Tax=Vigna unguiculata TaxID=3917 RepID=A0A4D6M3G5_VIGUN|nr:hypothetical protein DEO72_LG6g380 [Vigna unguiculata]